MDDVRFNRRDLLRKLAGACGTALLLGWPGFGAAEAEAAAKADKGLVHYQIAGCNGGRNCMHCRFFQPGSDGGCMSMMDANCKVVAGTISPMGYCDLFAPSEGEASKL